MIEDRVQLIKEFIYQDSKKLNALITLNIAFKSV